VVVTVVMLVVLLLTGTFVWVLIAGLRGSVRDSSTRDQWSVLQRAWIVLAGLAVLGIALAVTAALLIARQLGLADDSGGFFLTWFLCFGIGTAPCYVMAGLYGRRYQRAAKSNPAEANRSPRETLHRQ
jgi:hypothetical protein